MKAISYVFIMFLISIGIVMYEMHMFVNLHFTHAWANLFILLIGACVIIGLFLFIYKKVTS